MTGFVVHDGHIMNNPQQIYTGGAGEGGGFLKRAATATANTSQAFQCWATSSSATNIEQISCDLMSLCHIEVGQSDCAI